MLRLRVLHRWVGVCAAAFLLVLSASGIALNHSSTIGLDRSHISSNWLLDWYGIQAPEPGSSYRAGDRWVTLSEGRLYLDVTEVEAAGIDSLAGAVSFEGDILVASREQILTVSAAAEVIDRVRSGLALSGPIEGIAAQDGMIWLLIADEPFAFDPISLELTSGSATDSTSTHEWASAETLSESVRAGIDAAYRGRGLSLERLLADLHSGRLIGLGGVVMMDLAAIALSVLAVSGIMLWLRRR